MNVLIFGGTTEGRKLSEALSKAGISVTLSVATEYGKNAVAGDGVEILSDRLEKEAMLDLLKQGAFDYVIDATHPYAVMATQNIHSACQVAKVKYFRLKRQESARLSGVTYVPNTLAAMEILKKNDDKVLLTIGSKELEPFTHAENYEERFFIRILPMPDSLKKALDLGFHASNIICMQGPFDKEMNVAMLRTTGAKFLVTKDSGEAGGFEAKVSAALSLGCKVIVIARPSQEEGYTLDEILANFKINNPSTEAEDRGYTSGKIPDEQRAFFPLFIDLRKRKILVVGGGNVAERRIKVLLDFGADITVITPTATEYIEHAASREALCLFKRKYKKGDVSDLSSFFVIVATNDRQVNHEIMTEAKGFDIPVSVTDCREECTCYFPAIADNGSYIAGLVSKNGDHSGVKEMAKKIRETLNS
jgi:precorrin-2 dehydrogenase/sirohydrochlorin ferrochelatase/precorrin-6A/cobalt-precorrin-6A reductase